MINLKDGTHLVGVRDRDDDFPVDEYDDGEGPLWLYGHEFGVTMVIRARSFESAWEIAIDESRTIDEDEVPEAYGFDSQAELDAAVASAEAGESDYPELEEGYYYQSNCTGTGIVNEGHYAWLREMTVEDARERYRLVIRDCDTDVENVKVTMRSYSYTLAVRGKAKTFNNYSGLSGPGARLRKLERAIGACYIERTWE